MDVFEDDLQSSDEENPIVDEDTCDEKELITLFKNSFHLAVEESVSLKRTYVLHLSATKKFDKISATTSDNSVHVYNLSNSGLSKATPVNVFGQYEHGLSGVTFANNDPNILFISSVNGRIFMHDLRTQQIVGTFENQDDEKPKIISCFDINQNDRVLCAGTDVIGHDSFLMYFDVRQKTLLGGYWESHTDDVTQVKFHPKNPDCVATGSTDGLINIFDISATNEDDALLYCLNTESSVQNINWHKNVYDKDLISCITHTNDLNLYDVEESELVVAFSRRMITESIKRKSSQDCTLINCHNTDDGDVFLLAGSNYNKGKCMRNLLLKNKSLEPSTNYIGNKQIVRASIYNEKDNVLITSGESGIISIWMPGQIDGNVQSNGLKEKTKREKKHKNKPY